MNIYDSFDWGIDRIVGTEVGRFDNSGVDIGVGDEFLSSDGEAV